MPSGGARARSGPQPDPNSARSEKRGAAKQAAGVTLPANGYDGAVPKFPLPAMERESEPVTTSLRRREMAIWREIWNTPQAHQWAKEPWRWGTIAQFARMSAVVERNPDSNAALLSRLREWRNEIGLSPDGLRMNGWTIVVDQLSERRDDTPDDAADAEPAPRRLAAAPSA